MLVGVFLLRNKCFDMENTLDSVVLKLTNSTACCNKQLEILSNRYFQPERNCLYGTECHLKCLIVAEVVKIFPECLLLCSQGSVNPRPRVTFRKMLVSLV
jgi:hypothetical protein